MRAFGSMRRMFLAFAIAAVPASSFAGVFVSVAIAPQRCRYIRNRSAPLLDIYGHRDIGAMAQPDIIGCPERGYGLRLLACSGHRDTGAWPAACTPGTPDIGARMSVSMAA